MLADICARFLRVFKRVRLCRILFRLYQQPAGIICFAEQLEHGRKVEVAIAGYRKRSFAYGGEEAHLLIMHVRKRLEANILEMHMPDAVDVLAQHLDGIRSGKEEMTGIIAQKTYLGSVSRIMRLVSSAV